VPMRRILQYFLKKPLTWIGNKLAASPKREMVIDSLSKLYKDGIEQKTKSVKFIDVQLSQDKFIIFSDQHKGNKSWADDFKRSEINYVAALNYYEAQGFTFINLGDSEELWKFKATDLIKSNDGTLKAEAAFHPARYIKTFGNHDVIWKDKFAVAFYLKKIFPGTLTVYEGIILNVIDLHVPIHIFLTHGHQGDMMSDNNCLSTWLVAHVWMPMQRFLRININSIQRGQEFGYHSSKAIKMMMINRKIDDDLNFYLFI